MATDTRKRVLAAVDPMWRSFYEIATKLAIDRYIVRRTLHELVADGLVESRNDDTEYRARKEILTTDDAPASSPASVSSLLNDEDLAVMREDREA